MAGVTNADVKVVDSDLGDESLMDLLSWKRKGVRVACSLAGSRHDAPTTRRRTYRKPKPRSENKQPSSADEGSASIRGGVQSHLLDVDPAASTVNPDLPACRLAHLASSVDCLLESDRHGESSASDLKGKKDYSTVILEGKKSPNRRVVDEVTNDDNSVVGVHPRGKTVLKGVLTMDITGMFRTK